MGRLQERLNAQQLKFNRASVGRALEVLLERPGRDAGQLIGRSPFMQAVHTAAPASALGSIMRLRITAAHANSLAGVTVADRPAAFAGERATA